MPDRQPKSAAGGQANGRRAAARSAAAFTLLEMLTVVIIVGLLLTIGAPAVLHMQNIVRYKASLATIGVIDGACKQFYKDHEHYPPSSDGDEGRVLLWQSLAVPFRLSEKGKMYGPYNGVEKMPVVGLAGGGYAFSDAFKYSIYYYRWDEDQSRYNNGDNTDGPADIMRYVRTDGNASGPIARKDFILCSRGADGKWPDEFDNATNDYLQRDDPTNFLEE